MRYLCLSMLSITRPASPVGHHATVFGLAGGRHSLWPCNAVSALQQKAGQVSSLQKGDFEASAHVLGRMTFKLLSFVHESEDANTASSLACTIHLHIESQYIIFDHCRCMSTCCFSCCTHVTRQHLPLQYIWLYITVTVQTNWAVARAALLCY